MDSVWVINAEDPASSPLQNLSHRNTALSYRIVESGIIWVGMDLKDHP